MDISGAYAIFSGIADLRPSSCLVFISLIFMPGDTPAQQSHACLLYLHPSSCSQPSPPPLYLFIGPLWMSYNPLNLGSPLAGSADGSHSIPAADQSRPVNSADAGNFGHGVYNANASRAESVTSPQDQHQTGSDNPGMDHSPTPTLTADEGADIANDIQTKGVESKPGQHSGLNQRTPPLAEEERDVFDEKAVVCKNQVAPSTTTGSAAPLARTQSGRSTKLQREISRRSQIAQPAPFAPGEKPEGYYGMAPVQRQMSQPPAVSLFGGIAPSGVDAEEGLMAVRSREEEEAREAKRAAEGEDPWKVKFEPGEKANPKVSFSVVH